MSNIVINEITGKAPDRVFVEIAQLHKQAIKEGFLAGFSIAFLARLYRQAALSEHTVLYAATDDDVVKGFILGSYATDRFYSDFLIGSAWIILLQILPRLFSPRTLYRIFETLMYPKSKQANENYPKSEILNFCVSPNCQRSGVGKQLFFRMMSHFELHGVKDVKIITGESQVGAQCFYEKRGAKKVSTLQVHKGQSSFVYVFIL